MSLFHVNNNINYVLKKDSLNRIQKGHFENVQQVSLKSVKDVDSIKLSIRQVLDNNQKAIVNGWTCTAIYYTEDESWMTPEKVYEIRTYQIESPKKEFLFPSNREELVALSNFLE